MAVISFDRPAVTGPRDRSPLAAQRDAMRVRATASRSVLSRMLRRAHGAVPAAGRALAARRTALLTVSGFGSVTASVWHGAGTTFGLAALGASLLVVEMLSGGAE